MTFDATLPHRLRDRSALLTPAEMGIADRTAIALGHPGPALMEAAGRAVARCIMRHGKKTTVLVLAGPGNNGGDGYVAARYLAQQGWPVRVAALSPPKQGTDAAWAASRWSGLMAPFTPEEAARAGLVIDAVFGAGLTRPVDGLAAETLHAAKRVVAIDVPSGLDGATGRTMGFAPQAALTVTFFRLKPGHLLLPGRSLCGHIELADIGIPDAVLDRIGAKTFANLPDLWTLPSLRTDGHKYSRGHVTVVGGAQMTGAARLAADASRRAGAGMVTIAAQGSSAAAYRTGEPGLIVSDGSIDSLLRDKRRTVWVCGPGLGPDDARTIFPKLIEAGRQVVADADVFSAFADKPDALKRAAVLTPHEGEFTRVFGPISDRLSAARDAAVRTSAVMLLKGPDTVIADPTGRAAINLSAPSWLATAGAGDVLAGLIGGLLAQGMPAWQAACAAAYLHGAAANHAGPGMVVEDLTHALTTVMHPTHHTPVIRPPL